MSDWYSARPCDQIFDTFGGSESATMHFYPECAPFFSGQNPKQYAVVKADFDGNSAIEVAVALGTGFGAAGWLALAIHTFGIEIYVSRILIVSVVRRGVV